MDVTVVKLTLGQIVMDVMLAKPLLKAQYTRNSVIAAIPLVLVCMTQTTIVSAMWSF